MDAEAFGLSEPASTLLAYLVANLDLVEPDDAGTYLGYKRVHDELGLQRKGPIWGNSLRMQGLEELADWTARMNLPAITGLVIDQTALKPGDGFFAAHGRPAGDHTWWRAQIAQARAFDWTAHVNLLSRRLQPPWTFITPSGRGSRRTGSFGTRCFRAE